ncbi:MAG: hypothetical protein R3Y11_08480 [Pseudomonadota bacterium]
MKLNSESSGLKITGHRGRWYVCREQTRTYQGKKHKVFLIEHEAYGDDAACLIIDEDKNVILGDVWNGFKDLEEAEDREDEGLYETPIYLGS